MERGVTYCCVILVYWPTFQWEKVTYWGLFSLNAEQKISWSCGDFFSILIFFLSCSRVSSFFLMPLPPSGSPAELCRLCVDDEIVAVDGVAVAHMSYSQWKGKMASALQTGNLTMDIRRYGNKGNIINLLNLPKVIWDCLTSQLLFSGHKCCLTSRP